MLILFITLEQKETEEDSTKVDWHKEDNSKENKNNTNKSISSTLRIWKKIETNITTPKIIYLRLKSFFFFWKKKWCEVFEPLSTSFAPRLQSEERIEIRRLEVTVLWWLPLRSAWRFLPRRRWTMKRHRNSMLRRRAAFFYRTRTLHFSRKPLRKAETWKTCDDLNEKKFEFRFKFLKIWKTGGRGKAKWGMFVESCGRFFVWWGGEGDHHTLLK